MGIIIILSILLLCVALVSSQSFLSRMEDEVSDYCEGSTRIRVQMLFIFDQTYTFYSQKGSFSKISENLVEKLSKENPGSEFGLAVFADYDVKAGLTDFQNTNRIDPFAGPGDCYRLLHKFTEPNPHLKAAWSNIQYKTGSLHDQYAESVLTAVTLGAADKKIGWKKGYRDPDGKVVRKIIVLGTDATSTRRLLNNTGRHEIRGDGTDTCENTLPPTDQIVEKILKENGISVVSLLYTTNDMSNYNLSILQYYNDIFGKMDIPYAQYEIDFGNPDDIEAKLFSGAKDVMDCDEEDPPAYNTLGL